MKWFSRAGKTAKSLVMRVRPPAPSEYLPEAVQKEIWITGLTHPGTRYPLALGIGCGAAGLILGTPLLYLLALGGGVAGSVWAIIQLFFLPEKIRLRYLERLNQQRALYKESLKAQIQEELAQKYSTVRANDLARKGRKQFERAALTLEDFSELLAMKLSTGELLFHRFLAAAEQTYFSVLDNLKDIIALLKSADSIDPEDLESRVGKLERIKKPSQAEQEEKDALQESLKLWQEQMRDIEEMIAKNERAMTEMKNISAKVAKCQTDTHFGASDIELAINELQQLARYAHKLNNHTQGGE